MTQKPNVSGRTEGTKDSTSLPSETDDQIQTHDESHGHDDPFEVTEQSLKLIRFYYGESKPEFTQGNGTTQDGDQKGVMLANSDGQNPRILTNANHQFLTARQWSDTNMYWTIDIDGRRLIVKHVGSFRAWLGINRGFQNKTIAYPLTQPLRPVSKLSEDVSVMTISEASVPSDSGDTENQTTSAIELSKPHNHTASEFEINRELQLILDTDRNYYENKAPPYVFDNDTDPQPYFVAVLADGNRRRTNHQIEGQDCVVAKFKGGGEGGGFCLKRWSGHVQGFSQKPVAYSVREKQGHSQKPPTSNLPNPGLMPKPELPPPQGLECTAQPSHRQDTVHNLRSNQTQHDDPSAGDTTESDTGDLDEWIQKLRSEYGSQKPEFVREKGAVAVGETEVIVAATWRGQYPSSDPTLLLITAQRWDEHYIFWLRENTKRRYIVAPFEVKDRIIYRRWYRGVKAFMQRTFAFEPDATISNGLATTEPREKQPRSLQAQTTQGKNRQQLRETAYTSTAVSQPARPGKRHRDVLTNENPEDARPSKSRSRALDTTRQGPYEASVEKQQHDITTINPAEDLGSNLQATQARPGNQMRVDIPQASQRKQQLRQQLHMLIDDGRKLCKDELQEIEKEEKKALKGSLSPSDRKQSLIHMEVHTYPGIVI
ncbi:MAG: hypothetical protein Q9179_002793 [Wetmoreana sp. 5 TL-2023]